MSGYLGGDAGAEHALVISENGVHAVRQLLEGNVLTHCNDCGIAIPEARRQYAIKAQMKCDRCVTCQELEDQRPKVKIKMLDYIL